MQIVICDDLKVERDVLRAYIGSYSCQEVLDCVIEEYENAESLLSQIKNGGTTPDILFMDIYMGGMTGIEAVKALKNDGFSGTVIFITTSESHAVESYRLMADGYMVKPYTEEEFHNNFAKALGKYTASHKTLVFSRDRINYTLLQKDLEFVEAAARGSLLHAKGKSIPTTKPLADFAADLALEDCFLRCHRSCIVNLNFVERVEADHILMKNGAKAPMTMKDKTAFKKAVSDYFFLKMRED